MINAIYDHVDFLNLFLNSNLNLSKMLLPSGVNVIKCPVIVAADSACMCALLWNVHYGCPLLRTTLR